MESAFTGPIIGKRATHPSTECIVRERNLLDIDPSRIQLWQHEGFLVVISDIAVNPRLAIEVTVTYASA